MTRAMLLAAALLLASAATAADEPTQGTPKKTSAKPSKASTKGAKEKPGTSKTSPAAKGRAGASSAAPGVDPAQLTEVFRAKTNLLFAVESCERPDRCDKALRADSEERFMKACQECAPQERCEADRQTIREGNGKRSYNPCSAQ